MTTPLSKIELERREADTGRASPGSKLESIVTKLKERVVGGEWSEGEALPSRNRLAEEYGASPSTISNAINHLQKAGLVHAVPSRGVFASPSAAVATGLDADASIVYPPIALRGSYVPNAEGKGSFYGRSLVHSIWDAAHELNASVLLMPGAAEGTRLNKQYCQSLGAKGVVFLGGNVYNEAFDLRAAGFPVVLANRPSHATPLNYVDYDHERCLREAISRFAEAGHTRICVIIPPTSVPHFYDSLKPVFIEELCNRGILLNFNRYWIYSEAELTNLSHDPKLEATLTELLLEEDAPTAVLCFSYASLKIVHAAERNAGKQLSVLASAYNDEAHAKTSGFLMQQTLFGKEVLQAIYRTIDDPLTFIQKRLHLPFVDKGTLQPLPPKKRQ